LDPDAVWDGEWGRSRDGCIRWGGDRRREGLFWGVNLGRPTVTNGDFATRLFPINYFGQDLFCFVERRGGTTVFVTVDRRRFMTYNGKATKFLKRSNGSSADVELVITMTYSTHVAGNATSPENNSVSINTSFSVPVFSLYYLHL